MPARPGIIDSELANIREPLAQGDERTQRRALLVALLASIFGGSYAMQFWTMVSIGMGIPLTMLIIPWTRTVTSLGATLPIVL